MPGCRRSVSRLVALTCLLPSVCWGMLPATRTLSWVYLGSGTTFRKASSHGLKIGRHKEYTSFDFEWLFPAINFFIALKGPRLPSCSSLTRLSRAQINSCVSKNVCTRHRPKLRPGQACTKYKVSLKGKIIRRALIINSMWNVKN